MNLLNISCRVVLVVLLSFFSIINNAEAGQYKALENVQQLKVVFDVSTASPQGANNVFWAVRNLYQDEQVTKLPEASNVVVVFRGPATKLVSTDLARWSEKDSQLVEKFQETVKSMRAEGVVFEICQYAMSRTGVSTNTVMPEVDQVGNGFVSIGGYQMKGYGVITIQ